MKKRVLMLLPGIVLFINSAVCVYGETGNDGQETVKTGTQTGALEEQKDVDADIKDDIDKLIPDDIEEITIKSAEDFVEFSEKCKLDTWSVNKKVILAKDISLANTSFSGVPTFGGEFDGCGHEITDFSIKNDMSYVALFSNVQKTGIIKNLVVKGTVVPTGKQIAVAGIVADNHGLLSELEFEGIVSGGDYVAGIAGKNELTGNIKDCNSKGYIKGVHFTGGIAGENMGNISGCINESAVNTTNVDSQITIDSVNTLNKVINMLKKDGKESDEANADITTVDIGGVAGTSIGIISGCINKGQVGYRHVGYNVGGIVGRQSGYVSGCTNNGVVRGRKDVGGIVGQAEPYITVDLSRDVAYQLNTAISELHNRVSATLKDVKYQSGTITNRLNVIQQYTAGAIEDVRFISNETADFANGVSGSTSEAFSRVQYILEESAKDDGLLDNADDAVEHTSDAARSLKETVGDLKIEQYMSDSDREKYERARDTLDGLSSQYANLSKDAYRAYFNYYIDNNKGSSSYSETADLTYSAGFGTDVATDTELVKSYNVSGEWKHSTDGRIFPDVDVEDDKKLSSDAASYAQLQADLYAKSNYQSPIDDSIGSFYYDRDLADSTEEIRSQTTYYLPFMADAARGDALDAMNSLEKASDNLESAGDEAKGIVRNVAGRGAISFPQFSSEYKAHTVSLSDNMQGMNDNFGLLNNEMNSATGVIVDDLQSIADQFNVIMNLYADAIDGVLEKDYSNTFEDVSLEEALICTDATIDRCINYGATYGDIDTSGIAGTMAIEYDFDAESDITGIKDAKLNTSFISKCVLRDNRNYNTAEGEKSYIGGICGLQEMGTVINCANYGNMKSNSGEYVGGICGSSLSYIVSSSSKGILDGMSYVGGIAGDGTNIRDCRTLVDIKDADSRYGAIAGHVSDDGEVRGNFFVSDTLAGIDRVSYSLKAEPVPYDSKELPADFENLTVTFELEDEESDDGNVIIKKGNRRYGEKSDSQKYPVIEPKDGYYVAWDKASSDFVTTDEIVTAKYCRYRTTISEEVKEKDEGGIYQSEILVDGKFKDEDKLIVEREDSFDVEKFTSAKDYDADTLKNYTTIKVTVPDDGQSVHTVRYKPVAKIKEALGSFEVYLVNGDEEQLLTKTGEMGEYSTYDVEGNEFTLKVRFPKAGLAVSKYKYMVIGAIIIGLIFIALLVIAAICGSKKVPKIFRRIARKLSKRIEGKEQIFYDDSDEDKK
ncbi:MAG: hypothetical protein IKQ00_01865 [Butyrivibrio sp.]|nr:hypothetical protein [Butyrivibrio sp.]